MMLGLQNIARPWACLHQSPSAMRHEKSGHYKKWGSPTSSRNESLFYFILFFPILSLPLERRTMNQIEQIPRTRVDSALEEHPLQIRLHSRGPSSPTGSPSLLPCACE